MAFKMKGIARLLGSALLAALAMIVWRGAIFYWTDLSYKSVARVYDAGEVARFLQPRFPESGTYMVPGPHDDPELRQELRETGPTVTLQVLAKRDMLSLAGMLGLGFLQLFVTAILLGGLLTCLPPNLEYRGRVAFVTIAGLGAAIFCDLSDPIWWYHPWPWSIVKAVQDCTAWTVAGLILAKFVEPKPGLWIPRGPAGNLAPVAAPTDAAKADVMGAGEGTRPQS